MPATQQFERTVGLNGTHAPHRFRAATVEDALRQVRASLGEHAEIVEANRIRRGGIGGFFATELGVEVVALGPTADVEPSDAWLRDVALSDGDGRTGDADEVVRLMPDTIAAVADGARAATPAAASPVDSPARPSLRARQAWRHAIGDGRREPTVRGGGEQPMMPGLEAMLDEAARSERSAAPLSVTPQPIARQRDVPRPTAAASIDNPAPTDSPAPVQTAADGQAADSPPTTFADHFLRELIHDAEELRRGSDRNIVLPASPRTLDDGSLQPRTHDPDEPPAPLQRRVARAAGATEPIIAPDVLPGMPNPLPEPTATAKRPARSSGTRPRSSRTKGQGSTPRSTRAARQAEVIGPVEAAEADTVTRDAAPELPLEHVAAPVAVTTATASAPGTDALAALVDRCMQFAVSADRDTAPRKVALAVTLADGGVMKLTVEMPRTR